MTALLSIRALSRSFGSLKVIDDFDLDLGAGEALGIIGPNGAGKSTLFNLITGNLAPGSGVIEFDGADITRMPVHRRCRLGIGRSYQIPHPLAGMTVFENLLVGATFGRSRRERDGYGLCARVLELTGLDAKANALAGSLTLLERKRLELARALATEPRLLLLDEIAGGLTEHEVRDLVETIHALRSPNLSIIWIEHIVHALISVVERLVVIDSGRKLDDGAPDRVIANPEVQEVYLGFSAE